jgi:PAS domain S-box-containing protein
MIKQPKAGIERKLFERQLAKATRAPGAVDIDVLADLVVAAYEDAERDRVRTDRSLRLMAEEIEQAHQQLVEAFDIVPGGLVILDAKGRYVRWNRKFADLYNAALDKIQVGASFAESIRTGVERGHYLDAAGREEVWLAERLKQHDRFQSSAEQHISGDRWVRVEERRTADGGSIGLRIDITDLKRREETSRLLFDENPIPMWVIDRETSRFLAVNNAAIAHYGYSREEFLKLTPFDIRPLEDHEKLRHSLRSGDQTQSGMSWRHLKADGSMILVTVYSRALVHDGRPAWLSAIFDVTERARRRAGSLHGPPRSLDRPTQSRAVSGRDRGRERAPARAWRKIRRLHAGPRPLQGCQRLARAPGGRCAAQGYGAAAQGGAGWDRDPGPARR